LLSAGVSSRTRARSCPSRGDGGGCKEKMNQRSYWTNRAGRRSGAIDRLVFFENTRTIKIRRGTLSRRWSVLCSSARVGPSRINALQQLSGKQASVTDSWRALQQRSRRTPASGTRAACLQQSSSSASVGKPAPIAAGDYCDVGGGIASGCVSAGGALGSNGAIPRSHVAVQRC